VKLADILKDIDVIEISGSTDIEIAGIACDSRQVKNGFLFVAVRGLKADGLLFAGEAVSRGARAVMCEPPGTRVENATRIIVSGTRRALAQAAASFHANPSKSLGLVGITGTNGKTTVCYLIRNILESAGWQAGMIGTVEYRIGTEAIPADRTTPDPLVLNSLMAKMREKGCRYVVMEVSSHSLDQHRVGAIEFDVAVFTNITRDHLDYHRTLGNYLQAKASLFESLSPVQKDGFPKQAVICTDQPEGSYIAGKTKAPVATYGFDKHADVTAEDVRLDAWGSSFVARTPWGSLHIESCLIGRHNVSNILAAVATGLSQGVDANAVRRAIRNTHPVPGRLEFVPNTRGYSVVVDYAHTDDALKNVLTSLREITRRNLIVVFGCGGDRDRGKREKMGSVVNRMADFAVVTSDNPRSEDPMEIISEILRGFNGGRGSFAVEPDRRAAIAAAISMAEEGDTVLIAGKGHETYQEFNGYRIDFDDRKVARELLACP
jgi:UDP-N-acetylmuramoyl-L-alanyl-D-glutamate--2,6-diaminopimelate ligase